MQEAIPLLAVLAVIGFVVVLVAIGHSRRAAALGDALAAVATEQNVADIQRTKFLGLRVRGMWNGFPLEIVRVAQQKSVPERLLTRVRLQVPARLSITRRRHGAFSRPLTWFGPPLIEHPLAGEFWVRSDEISLVERIFASRIPALLARSLSGSYDFVRLGNDSLSIQRQSDRDVDAARRIAREELELAKAIIDALALRP